MNQEQIQKTITLYNNKLSLRTISKQLNIHRYTLSSTLKQNRISLRTKSEQLTGKKVSKEARFNMKLAQLGKKRTKKHKLKISKAIKLSHLRGDRIDVGKKISLTAKKNWQNDDVRNRTLTGIQSEENRKRLSKHTKNLWKKQSYRNAVLSKVIASGLNRPNQSEKQVLEILNKLFPNQFAYVGDGTLILGKYNPDFVHKNKKLIIEFFGDYWHKRLDYIVRDKKKLILYAKLGYETFIITDKDLKNQESLKRSLRIFCKTILDSYSNETKQGLLQKEGGEETESEATKEPESGENTDNIENKEIEDINKTIGEINHEEIN